ncbi:alpha/beta fold hydrolase [Microvirga arabica]|uniref:alpha/beta fold hydrolase n=1 Tax=Microvirga arabica TaxID=1128671 RepID=UPI0019392C1C|nr:alpha/beta hydrolase [Microvirga arabica]MBM1174195.1 alpha/beta hydrolase [Microvirga arabica]
MSNELRFAKHRLPSGLGLHVAEQGLRNGPAVLMLHGYSDSWFSYSRILPLLPKDWHVIVPDQRGHGESDRPDGSYAPADFAGDALRLLDRLDIERAVVVGHSMGSFVARSIAARHAERVEHLVLVGSAVTAQNEVTQDLMREVEALADPVGEDFVRAFQASTICRPVPAEFFERIVAESLKLPARIWKAALSGLLRADPAADLARIRCPVLILGGERDSVFSQAEQQQLASRLPGAKLKLSPDLGHDPHWEAPEDFVFDLLDFLRGSPFASRASTPS